MLRNAPSTSFDFASFAPSGIIALYTGPFLIILATLLIEFPVWNNPGRKLLTCASILLSVISTNPVLSSIDSAGTISIGMSSSVVGSVSIETHSFVVSTSASCSESSTKLFSSVLVFCMVVPLLVAINRIVLHYLLT